MKIRYLHYAPATAYEGVVPSEPDKLKELIDEQFAIDAKKVVADLISKNTDTIEYRGIYYNPTIGFIGYIRVPKNGTVENFKEYSFLLKTNEVHKESSIDMSEVVNKLNELTYSKEVLDAKLQDYVKTSELPDLTIYLTTAKAEEIYAKKTDIPTNVGGLTQEQADNRYAKINDIPDTSNFITAQNVEQTYAKKSDIPDISNKLDISTANATYVKPSDLPNFSVFATKTEVSYKADSSTVQSAFTALQNEITTKIAQATTETATKDYVKGFTKAVNFSNATINFSEGINFYSTNPSNGPVLKVGDLNNPDNLGKSGLVYINGTSIQGLSSDFVPINPSEATFSKGYVFFSYFFHPVQKKIIVQYLKDSTR